MTTEATRAAVPEPTSQGNRGSRAPKAKARNEADRGLQRRAQTARIYPQLLPGVGLQRQLGVLHDLVDQVARHRGVDPRAS